MRVKVLGDQTFDVVDPMSWENKGHWTQAFLGTDGEKIFHYPKRDLYNCQSSNKSIPSGVVK
jgi:predicted amidohydrolase